MTEPLPTIYHGIPSSPEDSRMLNAALQDIIARLNALPARLRGHALCSILATICCAQSDPRAVYQAVSTNVAVAIQQSLAEPRGHA